jgi:diguanylate cyclase (GGDEF)-like protein
MLQHHMSIAHRSGRPLAFFMIDVDHFKLYNDSNGHLAGDEVLRRLGQILTQRLRRSDLAARFGGEEFAVLLPETDSRHALEVAEELRRRVEATEFPLCDSQPGKRLTVSVGAAVFAPSMGDPDDLVRKADKALYEAKSRGRNQSVLLS